MISLAAAIPLPGLFSCFTAGSCFRAVEETPIFMEKGLFTPKYLEETLNAEQYAKQVIEWKNKNPKAVKELRDRIWKNLQSST